MTEGCLNAVRHQLRTSNVWQQNNHDSATRFVVSKRWKHFWRLYPGVYLLVTSTLLSFALFDIEVDFGLFSRWTEPPKGQDDWKKSRHRKKILSLLLSSLANVLRSPEKLCVPTQKLAHSADLFSVHSQRAQKVW